MEDSVKVQKEALKKRRFRSQAEDEEGPERKKEKKKKRGVRAEMM